MLLSKSLSPDVSQTVQHRGRSYFHGGRVRIEKGSDTEVQAQVRGSSFYRVLLKVSDDGVDLTCTCPFAEGELCKHIWATVLAAENRGYLSSVVNLPPLLVSGLTFRRNCRSPRPGRNISGVADEQKRLTTDRTVWPERRQILYVINLQAAVATGRISLNLVTRERKASGQGWNSSKDLKVTRSALQWLPDAVDREIMAILAGGGSSYGWSYNDYETLPSQRQFGQPLAGMILPMLCRTGRCFVANGVNSDLTPLEWDEGEPWKLELRIQADASARNWQLNATLRRHDQVLPLDKPELVIPGLIVLLPKGMPATVAALDDSGGFAWLSHLRSKGSIVAPHSDGDALLTRLLQDPGIPPLHVPDELRYEEELIAPRPKLHIRQPPGAGYAGSTHVPAELSFDYAGRTFGPTDRRQACFDPSRRSLIRRDNAAEEAAQQRLRELRLRYDANVYAEPSPGWRIPPKKLPAVVRALVQDNWQVEAEGKLFRSPGGMQMNVSSGVDWFELRGELNYDSTTVELPALLAAIRRGDTVVQLGDGTYGLLPEEWVSRLGLLAGLGDTDGDHVRFRRQQAGLLDAMLASQPQVQVDEAFARARLQLREFQGIEAAAQPRGFVGALRDYQREGLAWLHFLRRFNSAVAWQTTWAWARQLRCWRCWNRDVSYGRKIRPLERKIRIPLWRRRLSSFRVIDLQLEAGGS
ncbi:MAG: SWIM zinc finger family protein [Bryobacteraceae bacterium]